MTYEFIKLERANLIGTLTFNRPAKLNAMNAAMLAEFERAIAEATDDPSIRVLIIRGAGRAFSSGYDLDRNTGDQTIDRDREYLQANLQRWLALRDFPKPVIAMVHGYCLAGATQLCICADVTFVADDAVVGFPSVPAGAGFIGQSWAWVVGMHRAKYLSFLPGSQISGSQAALWGWATLSIPMERLEQETYSYASRIAKVPSELLRIKKLSINRVADIQGFRTAFLLGAEWDAIARATSGVQEVRAMIKEKGLRGAIDWFSKNG